jgi:hypothetical protein
MPTPAYTPFNDAKPVVSDTRQVTIDFARTNGLALRDAVIMGKEPGWTLTATAGTGTAEQPQFHTWAQGTERVRATYTYTSGFVTSILWEWSNDSAVSYVTIATETRTYDGSNNSTGGANSGFTSWLLEWMGKFLSLRTSFNTHTGTTGTGVHGLGTMSTQNAASVAITGGTADNLTIGGTTRALATMKQAREVHSSVAFGGATTNLDWSTAASFDFTATATGAAALTFTNPPAASIAGSIIVRIVNGGLRTWTWPTGTKWAGGTAPTMTAAGTDLLTFMTTDNGTTYHAAMWSKDSR